MIVFVEEDTDEEGIAVALAVPARGRDRTYVEASGAVSTAALASFRRTFKASYFANDN